MNNVKTKKGSVLPLLKLKGKDYLQVAHRLQWLSDDYDNYTIHTEFLVLTDEQTVTKSTVVLFNQDGKVIRSATATKRETKKDFPDHTEKSETGSVGRALAMLGLGTQMALSDLDEGERIVDSPVINVNSQLTASQQQSVDKSLEKIENEMVKPEVPKKSSFKVTKKDEPKAESVKDFKAAEEEWK